MGRLTTWAGRARAAAGRPAGRRVLKGVRALFFVGVVSWLVYRLSGIGWADVWEARPRTPWFYLLWLAIYFQLPLVEGFIYRSVWKLPLRESLPPILRKRALNQDVVSYSGEAYFFVWARQRLGLSDREVAGTLKDNAIASSLASWTAAVLLIGVFLYTGQIVLADLIGDQDPLYVTAGVLLAAVVVALGLQFRRTIFTLRPRVVLALFGAHLGRFLVLVYVLQILQWWVVLPEAPLSVWATMLAVMTIVNRIPLIPSKDLVGIGAVLGMTSLLSASAAAIAAMLLVRSALDKGLNLVFFAATYLIDRKRSRPSEHVEEGAAIEREEAVPAKSGPRVFSAPHVEE